MDVQNVLYSTGIIAPVNLTQAPAINPQAGNTNQTSGSGAVLDFSINAKNLQALNLDPNAIQTNLSGNTFTFSATQTFPQSNVNTNGTLDLSNQSLQVNLSLQNNSGSGQVNALSTSLNLSNVTSSTTTETPAVQSQQFDKAAQQLFDDINKAIQRNPNADMATVAKDVMMKDMQPFMDVLRYTSDFLFKLAHAQAPSASATTPYAQTQGTPQLNFSAASGAGSVQIQNLVLSGASTGSPRN